MSKIIKKIVIWLIRIIASLVLIVFFIIPGVFTNFRTMRTSYEDFEDITNFNKTTKDLFRNVSSTEVTLESDIPFMIVEGDNVTFHFYDVKEHIIDSKWPYHMDLVKFSEVQIIKNNKTCIAAVVDGSVVAKRCRRTIFEGYDKFAGSNSNYFAVYDDGIRTMDISLIHLDDMGSSGWSNEFIERIKNRHKNDKDFFIAEDIVYDQDNSDN